ncbi:hypothetical protein CB0940_10957 [Cercospora beticola]|uniref:Uncharacterized protein n=1 Tax=Cercospora beticola TaxID=122368 RepID=A0A2G5HCX7_CERBT|nr:hypothetical protein CB0940_10957 [Cercospora beticola]PIA90378.1 hypothetical protein CB0940_10957 [Cercospora beticola]WPB07694.1 hypothetical protein RHO25_012355 [Cercospora beticola]CAK1356501.1 unnamed protein product [Cercospora beticola]
MPLSTSAIFNTLLFLSSLHPTTARVRIRTYTSPTTTSNSTALLACITQMHSDLQANPRARAMPGYTCGNSTFYYGTPGLGGATGESDLYAVEKCEPDMTERAREGRDWFECRVRAAWGERRVGWKGLEGEGEMEEEEEEQELEEHEERDVIDGAEGDAEDGMEYDEGDETYEVGEANLEEGDWKDEIDGEEYDEDAGTDDEEDDEQS